MGNISTYSTSISIPDAASGPRGRALDTGLGAFTDAAQHFAIQKAAADQQAQSQDARVRAVTGLSDLAQKYERDPDYATAVDRYNKEAADLRTAIAGALPTQAQQREFGNDFDLLAKAREVSLKDRVFVQERDARVGQLETSLADFARMAASAANTVERDAIVELGRKNIAGMAESGYLSQADAAKMSVRFAAGTDEVAAMQAIERNAAAAVRLLNDPSAFPALDPERRVRLRLHAESEVKAAAREAQARASEAAAVARSSLADAMQVIRSGLPVDPALIQGAAAAASASGRAELVESVREISGLAAWQNAMRKATPVQLQEELGQLAAMANEKGADAAAATKFTIGRELLSTMSTELSRDPLSWSQRQGVTSVTPLSFQAADAAALGKRAEEAHKAAGYYSVAPKFFTDEERSSLKQMLAEAPAQAQLALATSIVKGFGKDAVNALGEISSDAPVFAHLGGLLAMGPQYTATVEAGFLGAKAIAEKNNVVPGGARLDTAVSDVLGGAFDERSGAARVAAIDTAKAIYTAEALRRGLTADTFDEGLFKEGLQKALGRWETDGEAKGGVGAWRGRDVLLPAHMSSGELKDTLRGMTDQSLAALSARGGLPVHADGTSFTADELRGAYLVSIGPGLYQISVTDPARARELVLDSKTGGYYALDLSDAAKLAATVRSGSR